MESPRNNHPAFGSPGYSPNWTDGSKQGVGTSALNGTFVWFTLINGILSEVYYPTVDAPQIQSLQFLLTDGKHFLQEEDRDLKVSVSRYEGYPLGYLVTSSDPQKRYHIKKDIIASNEIAAVLINTTVEGDPEFLKNVQLYSFCKINQNKKGITNGYIVTISGQRILLAEKDNIWIAIGTNGTFSRLSCGALGVSDGLTDLETNYLLDWEFDLIKESNIGLIGQIDFLQKNPFCICLAFGLNRHSAIVALFQALSSGFKNEKKEYIRNWNNLKKYSYPIEKASCDGGTLMQVSHSLLRAHGDKLHPGAMIASLSIPWGTAKPAAKEGGYHLVWTRDMVNSSMGLLAIGDTTSPLRGLIYLASSQNQDGGFYQNFWVNGEEYWHGVQLDEVSFPILLAYRLLEEQGLMDFDPYYMVMRAARYLLLHGPFTEQERWEEASGYSPSTLATIIAALVCASCFARFHGDFKEAEFLNEYADYINRNVEKWTVTNQGSLHPDIRRHYVRINPCKNDNGLDKGPDNSMLTIANGPFGCSNDYPAKDIIDAGFLELVRYGIRSPDDQLIIDSLEVVDRVLKRETPFGPCWRRYNHDGYGQQANGSPFIYNGVGRSWPLLTGERAHYELAAQKDVTSYIQTLERLASSTGMLPEQIWDEEDIPEAGMFRGRVTGSATPLMWAHAEYLRLLRSKYDGGIFDLIPAVSARYLFTNRKKTKEIEVWKFDKQVKNIERGMTLRIQVSDPCDLIWTNDGWKNRYRTPCQANALCIYYFDLAVSKSQKSPIIFTFYWNKEEKWEGKDYIVEIYKEKPTP